MSADPASRGRVLEGYPQVRACIEIGEEELQNPHCAEKNSMGFCHAE